MKSLWHGAALFSVIIWGNSFVATKILLLSLGPLEILVYRFLIAYLFLLLVKPKLEVVNAKDEILLFFAGIFGITAYFSLENSALLYTSSANTSILVSTSPIFVVAISSVIRLQNDLCKKVWLGFALSFIGSVLVINGNLDFMVNLKGDVLAILSALSWAVYMLLLRKLGEKYNYLLVARKVFFYGIITSFVVLLKYGHIENMFMLADVKVLVNILFLSVVASAACYILWHQAIIKLGVTRTVNYMYLIPIVTMLSSSHFLKEEINSLMTLGAIFIICGVYLSSNSILQKAS